MTQNEGEQGCLGCTNMTDFFPYFHSTHPVIVVIIIGVVDELSFSDLEAPHYNKPRVSRHDFNCASLSLPEELFSSPLPSFYSLAPLKIYSLLSSTL